MAEPAVMNVMPTKTNTNPARIFLVRSGRLSTSFIRSGLLPAAATHETTTYGHAESLPCPRLGSCAMRPTGRGRDNTRLRDLRRHDLRHTGLTWMADAGVSLHLLQKFAGHADSRTTERYLHPDRREVTDAGDKLSNHLRSRSGPALRVVG
ncbi:tyrosine-type recombinase/integrase [Nocardia lasii]|uniref:Tyrosine-type recombinase/integrase n=1 Tax=Nocardia lasii TaxID=1616107 RepID=A0ABW1JPD3_9NOCA